MEGFKFLLILRATGTPMVQCNWSIALKNSNTNVDDPILHEPIRGKAVFPLQIHSQTR